MYVYLLIPFFFLFPDGFPHRRHVQQSLLKTPIFDIYVHIYILVMYIYIMYIYIYTHTHMYSNCYLKPLYIHIYISNVCIYIYTHTHIYIYT
jgi:hypothetical protein